jgi:hypothetical protein
MQNALNLPPLIFDVKAAGPNYAVKSPATWRDVLNHLERVFER